MNLEIIKNSKILIVDDNPSNLRALHSCIRDLGCTIMLAQNGKSALEIANRKRPDLILLDILMPEMDGFEVCRRLKESDAYSPIIIFVTASTDVSDKTKGFNLGAADFITKPFQKDDVIARSTIHLGNRKLQKELQESNERLQQEIVIRRRIEEMLHKKTHALGERVQELNCLYGLSQLVETEDISLNDILQGVIELIPPALQYSDITCARVVHDGCEYRTENFKAAPWRQTAAINVYGLPAGCIEAGFTEERTVHDEGPFQALLNAIAKLLGRIIERKQAEEELRLNRQTLDYMAEGVTLFNADRTIIYTNPVFDRMFGYEAGELHGKHASILNAPTEKTPEKIVEKIKSTLDVSDYWEGEITNIKKDGTHFTTYTRVTSFQHSAHGLIFLSVQEDISKRKRAEKALKESEKRLRKMIAKSPLPMVITDANQDIEYFNDKFTEFFGYTLEDVSTAEKWWQIAYPDEDYRKLVQQSWMDAIEYSMAHNSDFEMQEWDLTIKDRTKRHCEFYMVSLGEYSLIIVNDISEKLKNQAKVKEAKEAAEIANRFKSKFLANMSHEIRTPMNAILGFSEILEGKISNAEHRKYLSLIQAGGKSLLTLINDILDISKIEAGKIKLEYKPTDPVLVFKEIAAVFSQKVEEKGLTFTHQIEQNMPEYLLLDEVRLRQILFNLVGNALKFTESGSIRLTAKTRIHDMASDTVDFIFTVEDTGIGIPKEQQKTVFDAFEQQSGQDQVAYGGTGLGLAITKQLTELMGGKIRVSGEKNQGSVFTVTLQNVRKMKNSNTPKKEKNISSNTVIFDKAAILIVDDLPFNRALLIALLSEYDFEFIEVENGRQAVELARERHPDLILMDMKMPVMDGREATQKIKECKETSDIPIIAATAAAMKDEEKEIRSLCDGYLKKPINEDELVAELARFLKYSIKKAVSEDFEQMLPKAKSEPAPYTPDAETMKKIPELLQILETEFMPRHEEICDMLIMDEAQEFADDLAQIGRKYGFAPLTDYGDRFSDCVQAYDTVCVKTDLAGFPKIVDKLRRLKDKN
ncbi:response regulator [Desulfococcaceae bacterium HSG9]|nr:response regulator [Desulfococcaceae bacterium HSG9]